MTRHCAKCHKEHISNNYICEHCGVELIDNGQLVDALSFWGEKDTTVIKKYIVPLVLVTAFGVLSATLEAPLLLYVGIAAAAVYHFKSK